MPSTRALRAGKAIIELSMLTGPVYKQLAQLQQRSRRVADSFTRIGTLGMFGGGGGFAGLRNLFVGSAAAAGLAWPVKLAMNLESAQAQFTALTGDAEVAMQMVADLEQFSAISIVPVDALHNAAQELLGYGVAAGNVVPVLKSLTEISRGNADRLSRLGLAYGQTTAKQRLYAQEVRQFVEAGFNPLEQISRQTGESMRQVQERMENVGISADEVTNALMNATRQGGRFHGLLEMLGNTASGQMMKFWTNFKNAVRPLGQEVLPGLTEFFRALNGGLPKLANWIKEHKSWVKWGIAALFATAGLAVGLTSIGAVLAIGSMALGGFLSVLGGAISMLGLVASPVAWLIGGLGALAGWFFTSTEAGAGFVSYLAGAFMRLYQTVASVFQGIADALVAGNTTAAAEVMWAGLNLIWQRGTTGLEHWWIDLTSAMIAAMTKVVFDIQMLWTMAAGNLQKLWAKLATESASYGEQIGHWMSRSDDLELAAEQDAAHENALANIRRRGDARMQEIQRDKEGQLAAIEAARRTAQEDRSRQTDQQHSAAERELSEAEKRLERANAASRAARMEKESSLAGPGSPLAAAFSAGAGVTAKFDQPQGVFGTGFASQVFGNNEQTPWLKKIEKNTRQRGGGVAGV